MTITGHIAANNTGSADYNPGSFTPAANSTLYVAAWASRMGHTDTFSWGITNTGGLAFTPVLNAFTDGPEAAFQGELQIWSAPVGASPSSMSVTVDADTGSAANDYKYGVIAFSDDENRTIDQSALPANADYFDTNANTGTLAVAPSELQVALFGGLNDGTTAWSTPPAGWSTVIDDGAGDMPVALLESSTNTATSVTHSHNSGDPNWNWAVIIEFSAPPATTALDQEGYRTGTDDGTEAGHGWEAAENTVATVPALATFLLRVLLNETGGGDSTRGKILRYKRSDEAASEWRYVEAP